MLVSRKKEGASERLIRRLIRPRPRDGRVEGRGGGSEYEAIRREGCYSPRDIIVTPNNEHPSRLDGLATTAVSSSMMRRSANCR